MKSYFFEIKKFFDSCFCMEIAVIKRNQRIYHCILEITQIMLNHSIYQKTFPSEFLQKMRKATRIFPPKMKRKTKFFNILLSKSRGVAFSQLCNQILRYTKLLSLSKNPQFPNQRMRKDIITEITRKKR